MAGRIGGEAGRHGGEVRFARLGWGAGKVAFVELKAPGKRLRPLQEKRKGQLEGLGFPVYVVDRVEQIGGVLDEICSP